MARNNRYSGDGETLYQYVFQNGWTADEAMQLLGVARGTLYNYFNSAELTPSIKKGILKKIGVENWILFEQKYKEKESTPQTTTDTKNTERNKRRVPLIGEGAAGVDLEINLDNDATYAGEYIDVGDLLSDSEAAMTVYGNSMTPAYPPGCVLGLKSNYDKFIQPGETYVLVTKSNRVFKRLYYNDAGTAFTCYSDNTMKYEAGPMEGKYFYPPFEIRFEDVVRVIDVTGMIKRNRNSAIMQRHK